MDVAGCRITFRSRDRSWWKVLEEGYQAFLSEAPGSLVIDLVTTPDAIALPTPPRSSPPRISKENGVLTLDSWFRSRVDLERGRGSIRGPLHRAPVDLLLRQLLPSLLGSGLLIHGALVADEKGGWVIAGPSGSGKSTLASLCGERALGEEHCWVSRGDDGWRAHALPFRRSRPGWARVEGIYLLRHGARDATRKLAPAVGLRRLSRETVWPPGGSDEMRQSWQLLSTLVSDLRPRELAFVPSTEVWSTIAGERLAGA